MTGCGCALLLCCVRAEDGARCGKIWQAKNVNMMCMLFMLCYIGGKSVQKTALDVAELTKHVNVGGKREALLGSSDAAEEADRVRRGGAGNTCRGDHERDRVCTIYFTHFDLLKLSNLEDLRNKILFFHTRSQLHLLSND